MSYVNEVVFVTDNNFQIYENVIMKTLDILKFHAKMSAHKNV